MSEARNELKLVPAVRRASHFLDIVVDGVSLRSRAGDQVTGLNRTWPPAAVADTAAALLGHRPDPQLSPGRVQVLVCGECGDLGCGSLTVRVEVGTDVVRWSEWRWETGRVEDGGPAPDADLCFRREAYESEIAGAAERVAALPA